MGHCPLWCLLWPWQLFSPWFPSGGLERVRLFSEAVFRVVLEGLTVSIAQVHVCQEAAGLLPGDNSGKAPFPSGLAPCSGELHSPPQGFWPCLLAVVWRGTVEGLVLGGSVCSRGEMEQHL